MSFVLALLLLALSPAEGPGWTGVQRDGTPVRLLAQPERKGGLLVGRLWPGGQLVSIPAASLDEAKTAAANLPRGLGPEPRPAPDAVPFWATGPAPPPAPGDRARLKSTRREAERKLEEASGTGKSLESYPEREEVDTRRARRFPAVPDHTDLNGRGEEYWRDRAGRLRTNLREAESWLGAAERTAEQYDRAMPPGGPQGNGAVQTWARELMRLRNEVDRARVRVDAARRALDELAEEARRVDAYPGWLR